MITAILLVLAAGAGFAFCLFFFTPRHSDRVLRDHYIELRQGIHGEPIYRMTVHQLRVNQQMRDEEPDPTTSVVVVGRDVRVVDQVKPKAK